MIKLRHHSLVAWQRADDLFIRLHQLTVKEFPAFERFELGGQLRRAAYSVPANIVEGFARLHRRARLHFLNIAEASLAEIGYCLHVAERLGSVSNGTLADLEAELNGVGAPLMGLTRSTRSMSEGIPLIALISGGVASVITLMAQYLVR
jgi:four helix bundle protein